MLTLQSFPAEAPAGEWIYHTRGEHLKGRFEVTEVYPYQHEVAFETDDGGEFFRETFEPSETFEQLGNDDAP